MPTEEQSTPQTDNAEPPERDEDRELFFELLAEMRI